MRKQFSNDDYSKVQNARSRARRHLKFGRWALIRHLSFVIRHSPQLALFFAALFLTACYERKQDAVINPDGSGKILVETDVAVPTVGPGREKPTAIAVGRQYAADFINSTHGVDAWADVAVTENPDGRAHISAVAYFKDINQLHFDMPLDFIWRRDIEGATLTIQRTRTPVADITSMTDAELKALVAKSQAQYKDQQLALRTQLNAFKMQMIFELPGEISDVHVLKQEGPQSVSFALDGKKIADALDKFMADDKALTATFRAGKDLPENDDFMLQSMIDQKGPVSVKVKMPGDPKPLFDYRTEMRVAQLKESDMLKEAGVELVPKFIVRPAPATTQGK